MKPPQGFVWLPVLLGVLAVLVVSGGAYFLTHKSNSSGPGSASELYYDQPWAATSSTLVANPTSGPAPLKVRFTTDAGERSSIDLGDGKDRVNYLSFEGKNCTPTLCRGEYTYTEPGKYYARVTDEVGGTMATAEIVVTSPSNTPKQSISVPGMSKYTDTDFGFSFWYPSTWQVEVDSYDSDQLDVGPASAPFVTIRKIHSVVTSSDVVGTTMGGLLMIDAHAHKTEWVYYVPFGSRGFLQVAQQGYDLSQGYLSATIMAIDPSVAIPVSATEQIKIIQAEKDAYAQ